MDMEVHCGSPGAEECLFKKDAGALSWPKDDDVTAGAISLAFF